ncbi:hypothetical protein LIER_40773 [Lithospermum erythrorhizon]|uniref:Reverse transcriptase zinc-binding domain-containing protein n=1 Tax=Lithospermum erythrorhizon TaxID=34254 RepID=A0AAV3R3H7_LITER
MMSWKVIDNMKCVLCEGDEDIGHLFFECSFARDIWSRMLLRLHWRPGTWDEELQFMTRKGASNQGLAGCNNLSCMDRANFEDKCSEFETDK